MFSPNAETNAVKRDYQHIEVTPYGAALAQSLRAWIFVIQRKNKWRRSSGLSLTTPLFSSGAGSNTGGSGAFTTYFGEFGVDPFVEGIDEHPECSSSSKGSR